MDTSKFIQPDDVSDKPFIFVSYARKDIWEIQEILRILRKNRFRFWYDMGMKSGEEWAEELGEKIMQCDQFLVLLSDNSVHHSKYVRKELGLAVDQDKNIFAIYLTKTDLTSGFQLLLNDIQAAIHRDDYADIKDFERDVCRDASRNTLYSDQRDYFNHDFAYSSSDFKSNYEIMDEIGVGGFGTVFKALQKRTGNLVAVKFMKVNRTFWSTELEKFIYSEKKILSEVLRNMCPYVPALIDWYQDADGITLVKTLIVGKSLQVEEPLSEDKVVDIAKKVLSILRYLHSKNVFYGDIKPRNLIEADNGDIYLIDFNTAVLVSENEDAHYASVTNGYSAPEQFDRESLVDFTADFYALGRTMKYLLSPAYFNKRENVPIRYYRKDISVELEDILEKMTARDPKQRFPDADSLLKALSRYRNVNFVRKIKLALRSWNRSRRYAVTAEQEQIKMREIVKEMIDVAPSQDEFVEDTLVVQDESVDDTVLD